MTTWSRIVSENIPVLPVSQPIIREKPVLLSVKPKIVVEGGFTTKYQDEVKRVLLNVFKYRLSEYDTYKNGYVKIDEICKRVNSGLRGYRISKEDIHYAVHISQGKEFEFHPSDRTQICHVLSKTIWHALSNPI